MHPGRDFIRGATTTRRISARVDDLISTFFMDTTSDERLLQGVREGWVCRKNAAPRTRASRHEPAIVGIKWFNARDSASGRASACDRGRVGEGRARPQRQHLLVGEREGDLQARDHRGNGEKGCGTARRQVGDRRRRLDGAASTASTTCPATPGSGCRTGTRRATPTAAGLRGPDPKGPCAGADECEGHRHRSVRGGSWWWPWKYSRGQWRRAHLPGNKPYHHFGFRCAMSVPDEAAKDK